MVEDLLDASRISEGQFRLSVNSVDLKDVLEAAIDVVRPAVAAKGIQLQTLIDGTVPPVSGDDRRLQQVLWNLLSNAVKFTPEAGVIQVRLERFGNYARLVVKDTGSGITPEFLPHAFERFRQGEHLEREKHGGLGLGLAIARNLIELHGGTISVFSGGVGQGAEFDVQLPLEAASERGRVGPTEVSLAKA